MSLTKDFETSAAKLLAAASVLALTGCAVTPHTPVYNSTDAATRTIDTQLDRGGIRYDQYGAPLAVHYNACGNLQRIVNRTQNNRDIERSITRGSNNIGSSVTRRNGNIARSITGAIAGAGAAIVGRGVYNTISTPQIDRLEADCNQQMAYKEWQRTQKLEDRYARQIGARDGRTEDRRIDACIKAETAGNRYQVRGGNGSYSAGPRVSYPEALQRCEAAVLRR